MRDIYLSVIKICTQITGLLHFPKMESFECLKLKRQADEIKNKNKQRKIAAFWQ